MTTFISRELRLASSETAKEEGIAFEEEGPDDQLFRFEQGENELKVLFRNEIVTESFRMKINRVKNRAKCSGYL